MSIVKLSCRLFWKLMNEIFANIEPEHLLIRGMCYAQLHSWDWLFRLVFFGRVILPIIWVPVKCRTSWYELAHRYSQVICQVFTCLMQFLHWNNKWSENMTKYMKSWSSQEPLSKKLGIYCKLSVGDDPWHTCIPFLFSSVWSALVTFYKPQVLSNSSVKTI